MKPWHAWLPWAAAAAWLGIVLTWVGGDPRIRPTSFDHASVHNPSPTGLSAAYAYLRERAAAAAGPRQVGTFSRPIERASLAPDAVVFRVLVEAKPGTNAWSLADEAWVESGGRLVLALAETEGSLEVRSAGPGAVRWPQKVYPLWPGIREIFPPSSRAIAGPLARRAHAVFATPEGPLIARLRMGRGELILLACPEVFQNRSIDAGDHVALLETLCAGRSAAWFDEHVHGLASDIGTLELLRSWGLGPLLVLLGLAAAAAAWRANVRLGPAEDAYEETRREAVDFVESVAQIYRHALRRSQAAWLYYQGLVQTVSAQTGLRGEALERRVKELTGGLTVPKPAVRGDTRPSERRDLGRAEFQRILRKLNEAYRKAES